jgi:hypothetical protein
VAFVDSEARGDAGQAGDGVAAGSNFAAADLNWERCQEQAALAYLGRDPAAATEFWARGLAIAERHFSRGDPRLAASLTNHALVMRRQRLDYQAQRAFDRALTTWDDAWRWVLLMTPPHAIPARADGAATDHLAIYDREARGSFSALIRRGRGRTARLERHDELPVGGLDEWFEIKPRGMTDLRKLLGAVLLIAPNPHG